MATVTKEYTIGQPVYSLPGIEGFSAFDARTGSPALLWRFRSPAPPNTEAGREFDAFCSRVRVHRLGFVRFEEYGFSAEGYPYWVTESIPLEPLSSLMLSPAQIHYYFTKMVTYLTAIHRKGFGLGNLCAESFVVHGGRLRLVGIIPEIGSRRDEALANPEYAAFLAPEQREGKTATPASDIYALGVYLYRLITRRSFRAESNESLHLASLRSSMQLHVAPRMGANTWVTELLPKLLAWKPEARISDADELLSQLPPLSGRVKLEDAIFDLRLKLGGVSSAASRARSGAASISPMTWASLVTVVLVIIVGARPAADFAAKLSENYKAFRESDAGKAAEKDIDLSLKADLDRSREVLQKAVKESGKEVSPALRVSTKLNQANDELKKSLEQAAKADGSQGAIALPEVDLERAKRVWKESVEAGANYKEQEDRDGEPVTKTAAFKPAASTVRSPSTIPTAPWAAPWASTTKTTAVVQPPWMQETSAGARTESGHAAPSVQAVGALTRPSAAQAPVATAPRAWPDRPESGGAMKRAPMFSKAFIDWIMRQGRPAVRDWCPRR